ncbi:hypothetical protein S100757_01033 [Bacillus subtilis subsp. subtilis]|nr:MULTISPECIES: DUF4145 domain-containing protein [Bacillus]ARV97886.1 hypothetical protein S101444_01037 [Bacillus subtilis subsp. subtilis]ARW01965.1 hypothetical protein S100757_01033 [Bacillus subtilis subsp. subtilis]ASB56368.1 hypothetical protein S100761_01038 [Bacillus subtilis subsp. subtilis]MDN4184497.1 DUF4145 domain-containing protein [Bacillus subtilis]QAV87541.1 DUF4145 domain-containing protein [Bacillus subtilis]
MEQKYVPSEYGKPRFNCPSCAAFSAQDWYEYVEGDYGQLQLERYLREVTGEEKHFNHIVNGFYSNNVFAMSMCASCEKPSFWVKGQLVYPQTSPVPSPHSDMPEEIKKLYEEASSIVMVSHRASVAILRLAVEKLLPELGAKKDTIDKMIGELVSKGLPESIQKALDSLRVIGNNAVHPGKIDLEGEDGFEVALSLFNLLNFVVEKMITEKNKINEIYSLIPKGMKKRIESRDGVFLDENNI